MTSMSTSDGWTDSHVQRMLAEKDHEIERLESALKFMVECELATVDYMESLANPTKSQLRRHRKISSMGLNLLRGGSVLSRSTPRVDERLKEDD